MQILALKKLNNFLEVGFSHLTVEFDKLKGQKLKLEFCSIESKIPL